MIRKKVTACFDARDDRGEAKQQVLRLRQAERSPVGPWRGHSGELREAALRVRSLRGEVFDSILFGCLMIGDPTYLLFIYSDV